MSQELQNKIDELSNQNKVLTQQLANNNQGVEALMAQIDAHKSMVNEALTGNLQLKAHVILLEKHNKAYQADIERLNKKIAELEVQIPQPQLG